MNPTKRIITIGASLLLAFLLASCNEQTEPHTHTVVTKEGTPPTCVSIGITAGEYCSECGMILKMPEAIPPKGHTELTDAALAPTRTETGLTEGKHCSVCEEIIIPQQKIALAELTATEVFELAEKASVQIKTFDKSGLALYNGSGFVISSDGKVVTNHHVIKDAYTIQVAVDGVIYVADQILAYDKTKDIAVLRLALDESKTLTALDLCVQLPREGETVYAIGNPQGYTNTFSDGIVTCSQREISGVKYIQHNAATSTGSSGGALLNAYGEVIGIVTSSVKNSQTLNFAIAIEVLNELSYETPLTLNSQ